MHHSENASSSTHETLHHLNDYRENIYKQLDIFANDTGM